MKDSARHTLIQHPATELPLQPSFFPQDISVWRFYFLRKRWGFLLSQGDVHEEEGCSWVVLLWLGALGALHTPGVTLPNRLVTKQLAVQSLRSAEPFLPHTSGCKEAPDQNLNRHLSWAPVCFPVVM